MQRGNMGGEGIAESSDGATNSFQQAMSSFTNSISNMHYSSSTSSSGGSGHHLQQQQQSHPLDPASHLQHQPNENDLTNADPYRQHNHQQLMSNAATAAATGAAVMNTSAITCLVCYNAQVNVMLEPCHHQFHMHCIDRWLNKDKACPVCWSPIQSHRPIVSHYAPPSTHPSATSPTNGLGGFPSNGNGGSGSNGNTTTNSGNQNGASGMLSGSAATSILPAQAAANMEHPNPPSMRKGKWTSEESAFCDRLIEEFKKGNLPLAEGTTLRTFLSKLLNCDPMRISKKYTGDQCIGKIIFRRREDELTKDEMELIRHDLADLEKTYLEREQYNQRRREKRLESELSRDKNRFLTAARNASATTPTANPMAAFNAAAATVAVNALRPQQAQHPQTSASSSSSSAYSTQQPPNGSVGAAPSSTQQQQQPQVHSHDQQRHLHQQHQQQQQQQAYQNQMAAQQQRQQQILAAAQAQVRAQAQAQAQVQSLAPPPRHPPQQQQHHQQQQQQHSYPALAGRLPQQHLKDEFSSDRTSASASASTSVSMGESSSAAANRVLAVSTSSSSSGSSSSDVNAHSLSLSRVSSIDSFGCMFPRVASVDGFGSSTNLASYASNASSSSSTVATNVSTDAMMMMGGHHHHGSGGGSGGGGATMGGGGGMVKSMSIGDGLSAYFPRIQSLEHLSSLLQEHAPSSPQNNNSHNRLYNPMMKTETSPPLSSMNHPDQQHQQHQQHQHHHQQQQDHSATDDASVQIRDADLSKRLSPPTTAGGHHLHARPVSFADHGNQMQVPKPLSKMPRSSSGIFPRVPSMDKLPRVPSMDKLGGSGSSGGNLPRIPSMDKLHGAVAGAGGALDNSSTIPRAPSMHKLPRVSSLDKSLNTLSRISSNSDFFARGFGSSDQLSSFPSFSNLTGLSSSVSYDKLSGLSGLSSASGSHGSQLGALGGMGAMGSGGAFRASGFPRNSSIEDILSLVASSESHGGGGGMNASNSSLQLSALAALAGEESAANDRKRRFENRSGASASSGTSGTDGDTSNSAAAPSRPTDLKKPRVSA